MAEQDRPDTEGVLWDAVPATIAAMRAFLVRDNPATGQDFAAAAIETATSPAVVRALAAEPDGIEAVAMRAIAEAVEGDRRHDLGGRRGPDRYPALWAGRAAMSGAAAWGWVTDSRLFVGSDPYVPS